MRYLGVPVFWGRQKLRWFSTLEQRICSKLEGWYSKQSSQAWRTCLIKLVINMLANYAMGCLSMPSKTVKNISSKQSKFQWSKNVDRFNDFISWHRICRLKCERGLGLRVTCFINIAFLSKLAQRIIIRFIPLYSWTMLVTCT